MGGDTDTIRAFYAAFKRFQRLANDPGNQPAAARGRDGLFRQPPHAARRSAFDPSSGRRWPRGCYSEREELESRLRMLHRAERMRLVRQGTRPAA